MSQCVPNWEVEEPAVRAAATTSSDAVPYEMAELTWENGHLSMHGLGLRRPPKSYTTTTPLLAAAGTLESIVAPCFGPPIPTIDVALVPCDLAHVGSCAAVDDEGPAPPKKARVAAEASVSVSRFSSGTVGTDSWHVPTTTLDTISSSGLPAGTATANDDHDSVCHSRPPQSETGDEEQEQETKRNVKSSSSTRRSRAAAIHNQSERKRRDKINQKMKTLQKLVPNSNKTDKASMLDEVIEYLKQLQAQVQMMSRMSMTPAAAMNMMMPQLAMQQQLHMSMMAAAAASASPMGMAGAMGMGAMGMGMAPIDMARQNQMAASSFMPPLAAGWDGAATTLERQAAAAAATDPISSYLACQSQPMTIEAYSRMIALIQQQHQQLASLSKH